MARLPWVLGISASHNGAACLLRGDEIVVAVQEERLSGMKRHRIYGAEAAQSLTYCLSYAGIRPDDLDALVVCVGGRAKSKAQDIRRNPLFKEVMNRVPTFTIPHHYGHAVSAFATSGFEEAAILVIDGMGSPHEDLFADERQVVKKRVKGGWETISLYAASGVTLVPLEKHLVENGEWLRLLRKGMPRFGSLGGMYSGVAQQIFADAMEAGKVMGLAPYGYPEVPADHFFEIDDGQFIFHSTVPRKFRHDDRWPSRAGEYQDLACSVQAATEEALSYLLQHLSKISRCENLCYAGGVALNSVANEKIIRGSDFKRIYIAPAAEDSGPAIGAAYYGLWQLTKENTSRKLVHDACGRRYSTAAVNSAIDAKRGLRWFKPADVISETVDLLCEGKIIGWFDGRSELGPRALGQRSILCDPRRHDGKEVLNRRVKKRESFRPFAPSVLLDAVDDWFELDGAPRDSAFMLRVCKFQPHKAEIVPAVVHVDGTGRLQTVTKESNGRFYELIKKFGEKTGVPILLNTSFNIMGNPIVETPDDALECLLQTGLDCCVFEDRIVFKYVDW
jgi:carbamoyltransferase